MKKIITQNSKNKSLPSIFGTADTREYLRMHPINEDNINWLCDKLIEYACSKDALFVQNFRRDMRIPKTTWYSWVKKYPQLKEAADEADEYIAYGRYKGAATRHFDKGVIMHNQYRFGKEWQDDDVYQAALKKSEDNDSKQPIHVHLPENKRVINVEED